MRATALLSRTKKFLSKKRRAVGAELGNIYADGFSKSKVMANAREFQTKALKHEAESAFHNSRAKRLRKYLNNARVGRSDDNHGELPSINTTMSLSEEAFFEKSEASFHNKIARDAREKAVVRRLFLLKKMKKKLKK
jgi:hypothetical protein